MVIDESWGLCMTDSQQIDALSTLRAILSGSQRPKLAHIIPLELIAVGVLHDELSDDLLVGADGLGVWLWFEERDGWWRDVGDSDDRDRGLDSDRSGNSRAVVAPSSPEWTGERRDDPAQLAQSEARAGSSVGLGDRASLGGADRVPAERGADDPPMQHVGAFTCGRRPDRCHCSAWASAMNAAEPSVRAGLRRALSDVAAARSILATSLRGGSDAQGPFCYVLESEMCWSGRIPGVMARGWRAFSASPGAIRERHGKHLLATGASSRHAEPRCGLCGGLLGVQGADLSLAAEIAAHPVFGVEA